MRNYRRITQPICKIQVSEQQMDDIHLKLCTSLVLTGKPLRQGDKVLLTSPSGLIEDVLVRHVQLHEGFYVASIISEDMVPFDSWHMIRRLRCENDENMQGAA